MYPEQRVIIRELAEHRDKGMIDDDGDHPYRHVSNRDANVLCRSESLFGGVAVAQLQGSAAILVAIADVGQGPGSP